MSCKNRPWTGLGDVTMPATGQAEGQNPSTGSPHRDWNGTCEMETVMPTTDNRPAGMGSK